MKVSNLKSPCAITIPSRLNWLVLTNVSPSISKLLSVVGLKESMISRTSSSDLSLMSHASVEIVDIVNRSIPDTVSVPSSIS